MLSTAKSTEKLDILLWKANFSGTFYSKETALKLLKLGANPNVLFRIPYTFYKDTQTALHLATERNDRKFIEAHLEHGANQNIENHAGNTAIVFAAQLHMWNSVNALAESKHSKSNSENLGKALWHAVNYHTGESIETAKILLKAGADPNVCLEGLYTIHLAAKSSRKGLIRRLLNQGADPNILNYNKQTALEYSISTSDWQRVNTYMNVLEEDSKKRETRKVAMLLLLGFMQKESSLHTLPIEILDEIFTLAIGDNTQFRKMCDILPARITEISTYREKLAIFKKIYNALTASQTSYFSHHFFADKANMAPSKLLELIETIAEKKSDELITKAWELTNTHLNNCSVENVKLFSEIYYWSFANSGWFKKSNLMGTTFFSSESLKPELEKLTKEQIEQNAQKNADGRTVLIYNALRG